MPPRVFFVAEHKAHSIGLVYGRIDEKRREIAHLGAMWVEPAARHLGVGRALIGAVIDWSRQRGARQVVLDVTEGNAPAEQLYASAGFERTKGTRELRTGSPLRIRALRLAL